MFIVALFTIAKTWKQTKYPQTVEWIKKRWYIHTMEYYSALKGGNATHATTWMNLDNIVLCEVNQQQETNYCPIVFV